MLLGGIISPLFILLGVSIFLFAAYVTKKQKLIFKKLFILNLIFTILLVAPAWWAWILFHIK
jgi:hypothetical protein